MISGIQEQTLLDKLIRSCVFIHDDWIAAAGRSDWGAYDTNPFLLGADVCVVNTLIGFGQDYLDYLKSLRSLPEHIIVPQQRSNNLTLNLLDDEAALAQVRSLVAERRLDISVFYHDGERGLDRLTRKLTTPNHTPTLYPTKTSYTAANSKIDGRRYARMAEVPTPESAICHSLDEVLSFFNHPKRSQRAIFIKSDHRKLVRAFSERQIRAAASQFSYPLLVETLYEVKMSPSVNMVLWRGEHSSFVVTDQILHHWIHYGNSIPSEAPDHLKSKMMEYAARIGAAIPDLQGVFGVDFIITSEDKIFAVDINPRFCSGTYPQYFLQRMGISLDDVYARYRLAHSNIENLSTILCDPEFAPFTPEAGEGIFIYDPVVYDTKKPVNYFSHIAVAKSRERLAQLEQVMERMVEKYPPLA